MGLQAKAVPLFPCVSYCLLLVVLTRLVCYAAGGLAGRLAGGLALAASTGGYARLQAAGFNGFDSLHFGNLLFVLFLFWNSKKAVETPFYMEKYRSAKRCCQVDV